MKPYDPAVRRNPKNAACRRLAAIALGLGAVATAAAVPFAESPFGPAVAASLQAGTTDDPATGNRLALVENGYDALLLRVHLIRQAKTSIAIQTFIWTNDECGRLVMHELLEAARRGVKVRIIVDPMFSDRDPDTSAYLATVHPNLELKLYRPAMSRVRPSLLHTVLAGVWSFRAVNQRMHNKVMIFDDVILVTGGRNIENTYFDHSVSMNFRDRDVLAVGRVAAAATVSFEGFWRYPETISGRDLVDVDAAITKGTFKRYAAQNEYGFGPHFAALEHEADDAALIASRFAARLVSVRNVAFISDLPGKSGPDASEDGRTTREFRALLARARTSVVMQTPYLVLSQRMQEAFRDLHANHSGVRVRISTNSLASTDNFLAYSANYRLRNQYVEDLKLIVHEFKPHPASLARLFPRHALMTELAQARPDQPERLPFLCVHAKSLVVDDAVAFVGSYNLDPRSENLNTETGLLVEDEDFARELRAEIEQDMRPENSWLIAPRGMPLGLSVANRLVAEILSITPLDVWPIPNTSSFELRPGATPVPPDHPSFHKHYRDVGSFPGTDGLLSEKEILTRICKAVGAPLTPVL